WSSDVCSSDLKLYAGVYLTSLLAGDIGSRIVQLHLGSDDHSRLWVGDGACHGACTGRLAPHECGSAGEYQNEKSQKSYGSPPDLHPGQRGSPRNGRTARSGSSHGCSSLSPSDPIHGLGPCDLLHQHLGFFLGLNFANLTAGVVPCQARNVGVVKAAPKIWVMQRRGIRE